MNRKMHELYFNNNQPSGIDIIDLENDTPPTGPGWYRIGSYEYDIALDLAHLYRQIPFEVRKKLGEIEVGEKYYSDDREITK